MGTKFPGVTVSGYNASPPPDDGTQTASNLVTWAGHKTKLGDPLNTAIAAVNTALVSALDVSVRQISSADSTVAGDHWRTIEIAPTVTNTITVSLGDAATMTTNYIVAVRNSSAISQVISRVTGANTIDGTAGNVSIPSGSSMTFIANSTPNGYLTQSKSFAISSITASLGADVALNNTGTSFDGPSVAQGTAGTWLVSGSVTCNDSSGAARFLVKLWDGTTVIASGDSQSTAATAGVVIALSGKITSPAGNLRLSVQDVSATTGKILFNNSGLSKDSTITAVRIG